MSTNTATTEGTDTVAFTTLVGDLAVDVARLVRQEVALAAAEMTRKARDAWRNTILVGASIVVGALALLVSTGAIVLALGVVIPMWISALAIAAVMGGAAYLMFRRATSRLRAMSIAPTETFASLRTDETWAKHELALMRDQMSSTLGEVRRRLALAPPPKKPRKRRAAAKSTKKPTRSKGDSR